MKRRSGGEAKGHERRREKSKKSNGPNGAKISNESEDKRNIAPEEDIGDPSLSAVGSGGGRNNRRGGNNSGTNPSRGGGGFRNEEKESRRGGGVGGGAPGSSSGGGHTPGGNSDRERRERDTKQTSYERRQSKLPPRLAKQKEQNRYSATGTPSISSQEAWGPSNN